MDYFRKEKKLEIGKYIVWSYLEFFVAKKADAVIAVAQGIRDILIQRGRIGTKFLSYQMGPM